MPKGNRVAPKPIKPPRDRGNIERGKLTVGLENIEFDGALRYSKRDRQILVNVRPNVDYWENQRYKSKVEFASSFRIDGTRIGEVRGTKDKVDVPYAYHATPNAVFTHVHPREQTLLGGTFSLKDLENFAKYANKTARATAKEGTYSISKSRKFKKAEFESYIQTMRKNHHDVYESKNERTVKKFEKKKDRANKAVLRILKSKVFNYSQKAVLMNKLSVRDIENRKKKANELNKNFNTYLVDVHADLLKNQRKYGYFYGLERR